MASLQLARAAGRESELAVRTALGASRRALVRMLFSESLILSFVAAIGGVLVAFAVIEPLRSLLPPTVPRAETVSIDGGALLFAIGVSVATALVFGMLPAILSSRTDLASGVREGGYSTLAPHKERIRDLFIIGQIALGLVLANGAGLLVQSYAAVRGEEQGFESDGVLTLALQAAGPEYQDPASRERFYEEVVRRVLEVPGVRTVGMVSKLPLLGGTNGNVQRADQPMRSNTNEGPLVEVSSITGDYFEAMGIPLLRGRTLEPQDSVTGSVGVVINQAMADEVWPGENALGRQFSFEVDPPWLTVVGVVGSVRQWTIERPALAEVYFPYSQGWSDRGYLVVRSEGDLTTLVPDVRGVIDRIDPSQPPSDVMAMSERVERAMAQRRFYTALVGLFAIAALFLASAGIHGTVSYFVSRRVRELGIRMALGAGGTGIMRLVVRRGLRLAAWGIGVGLLAVWATTSVAETLVYGIAPIDVTTVMLGCLTLGGVTVAASALPALRAIRVPPVLALRSE